MTPGRHMLDIWLKGDGQAIGRADFLDENSDDGMPWLGLLMIAGPLHRRGLATEAFTRLAGHFRADRGWTALRLGVLPQNAAARSSSRSVQRLHPANWQKTAGRPTLAPSPCRV